MLVVIKIPATKYRSGLDDDKISYIGQNLKVAKIGSDKAIALWD